MAVGVFETLLVIDDEPIEREGHLRRLRDATGLDVSDFLQQSAEQLPDYHQLRIDYTPLGQLTATTLPISMPSLFSGRCTPSRLATKHLAGQRMDAGHGQYKIADRQELEALEVEAAPALPLLVDGAKNILETTRHNVFIVEGTSLVTPPLDGRILPGVTRQVVLQEALKRGLACYEEPVSMERAQTASGVFLTNALIGIGWVEQYDDVRWAEAPVVVQALHKALAHRWRARLQTASCELPLIALQ